MDKNQNKTAQNEVKEVYEKPQVEIIKMETEGILCASAPAYRPGGGR